LNAAIVNECAGENGGSHFAGGPIDSFQPLSRGKVEDAGILTTGESGFMWAAPGVLTLASFLTPWCVGTHVSTDQRSFDADIPLKYRGHIVSRRPARFNEKLLAITIDDGPDPRITPLMLKTLKTHGAKATFFVLGAPASRHPDLLRRMVAEGHAIGSHTYTHALRPSRVQAVQELRKTAEAIRKAIGKAPLLFRPPGGDRKSWSTRVALEQKYSVILWTLSSADTATKSADMIANNVIHTPSPGDIILMHDSSTKSATAVALPRILDELGRDGWKFVTVPEMLRAWESASPGR
jgi:chitin deacetylase